MQVVVITGMEDLNWEVFVINDDRMKNAFVIPGGKVFVFRYTYIHIYIGSVPRLTNPQQWHPSHLPQ